LPVVVVDFVVVYCGMCICATRARSRPRVVRRQECFVRASRCRRRVRFSALRSALACVHAPRWRMRVLIMFSVTCRPVLAVRATRSTLEPSPGRARKGFCGGRARSLTPPLTTPTLTTVWQVQDSVESAKVFERFKSCAAMPNNANRKLVRGVRASSVAATCPHAMAVCLLTASCVSVIYILVSALQ
jgi:hypothetical protein